MQIEVITRYSVMGREFPSIEAAESYVFDCLGEVLDRDMNAANLGPGQKIKIIEALWAHRANVSTLLSCERPDE